MAVSCSLAVQVVALRAALGLDRSKSTEQTLAKALIHLRVKSFSLAKDSQLGGGCGADQTAAWRIPSAKKTEDL